MLITDAARQTLGWSEVELRDILRALNFAPSIKPQSGEPTAWRRRVERTEAPPPVLTRPSSPFAALAALKDRPAPARRPRRRRKAKVAPA